jgi:hypothetical protein
MVTCEKCGGTGKGEHEKRFFTHSNPNKEVLRPVCPLCHGSGQRAITVGDLREAFLRGLNHPQDIRDSVDFPAWLKTRYGIGRGST